MIRKYAPLAAKKAEENFAWESALDYYLAYLKTCKGLREALDIRFSLARVYQRLGKMREGLNLCEEILKELDSEGKRLSVANLKLRILLGQARLKEAEDYMESIRETYPLGDSPEGLELLHSEALLMFMLGRYDLQEELSKTGIKHSQKLGGYLGIEFENTLAVAYACMGKLQEAKELYKLILQRTSSSEKRKTALGNLGRINLFLGNLAEAQQEIFEAIRISKELGDKGSMAIFYGNLAMLFFMQGRYKESVEALEYPLRWAEITDNRWLKARLSWQKAQLLYQLSELSGATKIYQNILKLSQEGPGKGEDESRIMAELGVIKAQEGLWEEAFALFERSLQGKIQPKTLFFLLIKFAEAALMCGKADLAREKLAQIEKSHHDYLRIYRPQNAEFLIIKGAILREKGDYNHAEKLLREGILLSKEIGIPILHIRGLYELAQLQEKIGKPEHAREDLKEAFCQLGKLLEKIPPQYHQSFRTARLFKMIEEKLSTSKIPLQELSLISRMEDILEDIFRSEEIDLCKHLILEGAIMLSGAKGGLILMKKRKESEEIFFSLEERSITLTLGGFVGVGNPHLFSKEIIRSSLLEGRPYFYEGSLYLPMRPAGEILGEVILEFDEGPGEDVKGILNKYLIRSAIVLERLYMKEEMGRGKRGLVVKGIRHTDLELKFMEMGILGHSEAMQKVYELVEKVAGLDIPVLLQGETGTGKELFARAIHLFSPRRDGPFLAISCAAMSPHLLDSELFGYVKGAFTGAQRDHKGLFEIASSGTLFLDDVEEMSKEMQKKLLRTVEDKKVRRIGAADFVQVDTRIICATNINLKMMLKTNRFREDLFYRLSVAQINLPPLRERREDIPLLIEHFLQKIKREKGIRLKIEEEALQRLYLYHFPGNLRELENFLLHFAIRGKKIINRDDVRSRLEMGPVGDLKGKTLREIERELVRPFLLKILEDLDWDIPRVCKRLSISQSTLYKRLKQLNIKRPPSRIFPS